MNDKNTYLWSYIGQVLYALEQYKNAFVCF